MSIYPHITLRWWNGSLFDLWKARCKCPK